VTRAHGSRVTVAASYSRSLVEKQGAETGSSSKLCVTAHSSRATSSSAHYRLSLEATEHAKHHPNVSNPGTDQTRSSQISRSPQLLSTNPSGVTSQLDTVYSSNRLSIGSCAECAEYGATDHPPAARAMALDGRRWLA